MIRFSDVKKTYKSGVDALQGVSFLIEDGEFVFIIGKSGSGKSTLMKCITREEVPTCGKVTIDNFDISSMNRALVPVLRRQIGMIYQDFRLIDTKTVAENIAFAGEIIGTPRKSLNRSVQLMLNIVGLKDKANDYPQELSGGEQQRVAIARAMLNNPSLIVADEPTGNLDPETSESIMALLLEINRHGTTVIICTHDSNLVDRIKKRVIEIDGGYIIRDQKKSAYKRRSIAQESVEDGFGGYDTENRVDSFVEDETEDDFFFGDETLIGEGAPAVQPKLESEEGEMSSDDNASDFSDEDEFDSDAFLEKNMEWSTSDADVKLSQIDIDLDNLEDDET